MKSSAKDKLRLTSTCSMPLSPMLLTIRPHRLHNYSMRPTATDSGVVCLYVGHDRQPCKNGETDQDAVCDVFEMFNI